MATGVITPNLPPLPGPRPLIQPNARPVASPALDLRDNALLQNGPSNDPQLGYPPNDGVAPVSTPTSVWSDAQAKKVVMADYQTASTFRQTNIEPKWQEAMETYTSATGSQRFWKGTQTPRSNLQVHQAFQQVQALKPQIIDAICGGGLDFDVEAASAGTTIGQTMSVRTVMEYYNRSLGGRVEFQTFRALLDRVVEDGLILGNGVQEFGWDGPRIEQSVNWQRIVEQEQMALQHPMLPGLTVYAGATNPDGSPRMVSRAIQQTVPKTVSRFFLDPVDCVDFYIDPSTRGPNVQMADFCLRRKRMTIEELVEYRGMEGWNVPDHFELQRLARQGTYTQGDTTQQWMTASLGTNRAGDDVSKPSIDPSLARLEVLRYWQKGRHVWILGGEHVMRNTVNQYAVLPFLNWCYVNKPGQFYGFSIPELLRGDQTYIKRLLDGRADELSLNLHPARTVKRGMFRSQSQSAMYPGVVWEADNPKEDVIVAPQVPINQGAYVEANAAESRSQKKTGITDIASFGTPTEGGNSATRTATGVAAQTNASNTRVHGAVAYIEDTFLMPLFTMEWRLIQMFVDPQTMMTILGPDGTAIQIDPVDLLNADPRFVMKTASRMKSRVALQNGGLQQINQFWLNPEIITLMSDQQGKTIDIESVAELNCDIFGLHAQSFFRAMTPQEIQAKQARAEQEGQHQMALQTARTDAARAQAESSDEAKIMVALITALAQAGLLNQVAGVEGPVQLEARRLDAEIAGGLATPEPAGEAQ